jgi:hypothetical protein
MRLLGVAVGRQKNLCVSPSGRVVTDRTVVARVPARNVGIPVATVAEM